MSRTVYTLLISVYFCLKWRFLKVSQIWNAESQWKTRDLLRPHGRDKKIFYSDYRFNLDEESAIE